jgi:hypothetical protein
MADKHTWYSVVQAAKKLGVFPREVQRKIKMGIFCHVKMCSCGARRWLIRSDDIDAELNKKKSVRAARPEIGLPIF